MSNVRRRLQPGETVIGFMNRDGSLIGQLAEPKVGHDQLADMHPHLRPRLKSGDAIAITIHKTRAGKIRAFGFGTFPPPSGTLKGYLRSFAEALVE